MEDEEGDGLVVFSVLGAVMGAMTRTVEQRGPCPGQEEARKTSWRKVSLGLTGLRLVSR